MWVDPIQVFSDKLFSSKHCCVPFIEESLLKQIQIQLNKPLYNERLQRRNIWQQQAAGVFVYRCGTIPAQIYNKDYMQYAA